MIKFSAINALVHSVTPVMEIESRNGGQPFLKRELIIDDSWDKDGKRYYSFVSIEFSGDRMAQLDTICPGMRVNVDGLLSGREYNNRFYNSVRGQSVTPCQAQQQYVPAPAPISGGYHQQPQCQQPMSYQSPPMPGGYPQPPATPAYPQQPQQYVQSPAPMPVATQPQQPYNNISSPGVDDLPFPH